MGKKLLYHITDYRNLNSILEKRALMAQSQVISNAISYDDIAHHNIQNKRSTTKVEVSPYGLLHDYVPFYFSPKSPMLYTIKKGNIENYYGQQSDIIYLVTDTDVISKNQKEFAFTDGHAIMALTEFYNDLKNLTEIDWHVMNSKDWFDDESNPDRKRRRQAEFLIYKQVEINLFHGIGVHNSIMKEKVEDILNEKQIDMLVLVRPQFYY